VLKSGDRAGSVKEWTTEVKGYQEIWRLKMAVWLKRREEKKFTLGVWPI
jgi:hypothetical protein